MSSATPNSNSSSQIVFMLLSAAIFGYFGFMQGLTATTADGTYVMFFGLLLWTLRIGAIGFAVSALLTMAKPVIGNVVYCIIGLATALGFAIVGTMDLMDDQHMAALPPLLAFIFAAWNGFNSWLGMRELVQAFHTQTK